MKLLVRPDVVWAVLAASCLPPAVASANPQPDFESQANVRVVGPRAKVHAVVQDSRSFMWTAGDGGVCRFDGLSWACPVTQETSAIAADHEGGLWLLSQQNLGRIGPDNTAFLKAKALKQRVIDTSRAELKAVCDRIGAAEKAMCDAHLQGISQLESRLNGLQPVASAGCSKPAAPVSSGDPQPTIRANMDLIRSAFACDMSRVATLQMGGADGGISVSGFANQHETTHAVNIGDHKKWDAWWASQWAYLLQQLDSVKEGNGTLLDNTLIVFGSDTTTAQSLSTGAHEFYRFPIWLAGGSNFAFKTGRTIKLATPARPANAQWRYHNTLLVSVARAFGLDINTFGTWDQGKGPMAELA